MKDSPYATIVLTKRRLLETFISPAFYAVVAVSMASVYLTLSRFVQAVDSSGLNFAQDPIYGFVSRTLSASFGPSYVDKLFAEGPYLFALYVSLAPILAYLAYSSVYRFGYDRSVGAIELVSYGPADTTSYCMAFVLRNLVVMLVFLLLLLAYFGILAAMGNLVLGPKLAYAFVGSFFFAMSLFSYGALVSVLVARSSAGVGVFSAILTVLLLAHLGSFLVVAGVVRSLSTVLSSAVQWISPFYYWARAMESTESGSLEGYLVYLLLSIGLSGALLCIAHFVGNGEGP